jgi:DNA processing protein
MREIFPLEHGEPDRGFLYRLGVALGVRELPLAERRMGLKFIINSRDSTPVESVIARGRSCYLQAKALRLSVLVIGEPEYPPILKTIDDPPAVLWVAGALPQQVLATEPQDLLSVALVGARRADNEGLDIARKLGSELAARGATVVSGLALGIDGAAHRGALLSGMGGATVAVLGGGHGAIYPALHRGLAAEIVSTGGAVISQYAPNESPRPHQFLDRNRIIAALSRVTVVVQAAQRSGSLSTANAAAEQGRDVFAVPGGFFNSQFGGCRYLIEQGAEPLISVEQLLESLNLNAEPRESEIDCDLSVVGNSQARILDFVRAKPSQSCFIQELAVEVARAPEVRDLHAVLLQLELAGQLVREPGDRIRVRGGI